MVRQRARSSGRRARARRGSAHRAHRARGRGVPLQQYLPHLAGSQLQYVHGIRAATRAGAPRGSPGACRRQGLPRHARVRALAERYGWTGQPVRRARARRRNRRRHGAEPARPDVRRGSERRRAGAATRRHPRLRRAGRRFNAVLTSDDNGWFGKVMARCRCGESRHA